MDAVMPFVFSTLLDSVLVLAGHGDSITGNQVPTRDPGTDDGGGGIGMGPIIAVALVAVVAVAVLVWLNRQERDPAAESRSRSLNLKAVAPLGMIAAVIATPLIVWTASSGGDEKKLTVERWFNDQTNAPELLVSLREDDLNTLETTNGKRAVRIECRGRDGETVLVARQKWPLLLERGYDYPHAHQEATRDQIRRSR